jgi:hypothetical protein
LSCEEEDSGKNGAIFPVNPRFRRFICIHTKKRVKVVDRDEEKGYSKCIS